MDGGSLFDGDMALAEGLEREGGGALAEECRRLDKRIASAGALEWGFAVDRHPPRHVPCDLDGRRVDDVVFHPAWHDLLALEVEEGLAGAPWVDERPGAHVGRAAKFLMLAQVEAGSTCCSVAMTYACVPALRLAPEVASVWEPLVTARAYDPRPLPGPTKRGALMGMALTEQGGGSDLRTNVATRAEPTGDGHHLLNGSKWFVSAIHSDAFFVLARTGEALSCFLVPRRLDDGSGNGIRIDRLKDKLGNRSNPTAEVELRDARGWLIGPAGRGTATIMEMVGGTRLDCTMAAASVMRIGLTEALRFSSRRFAFGAPLLTQPLMRTVLADLALESEAATAAALRLVRAYQEERAGDERAGLLRRIGAPLLKYWVCKRAAEHAAEALESCGGGGYAEDSRVARNFREAPLPSIWEGSGNIQALDVLRALQRAPEARDVLLEELALAEGADRRFDTALAALRRQLVPGAGAGGAGARRLAGSAARAFQASILLRHAPAAVADAFCASRLGDGVGGAYGELPAGVDVDRILQRAAG